MRDDLKPLCGVFRSTADFEYQIVLTQSRLGAGLLNHKGRRPSTQSHIGGGT
jgi:hypothetical protein